MSEVSPEKGKRKAGAAFMKPVKPDEILAAIIGNEPLPRTEVTRKLWDYIRSHNLQDPENKTFIRISRLYWKDDLWIVEHRPGSYLRAVGNGLEDFFSTATTGWAGGGNVAQMSRYDRWFDELVYGRFGLGRTGLFAVALYIAALLVGLSTLVRRLRPGADAVTVAVAVATVTILNVGLVGNLAEVGENYRFRFVVDPLALALVAFGLHRLRLRRPGGGL